ncbi:MAG: hypothetical protein E7665_08500 [Ruminococcaceae bacterium]|nr:hypothetical protein [Oscillospiraceae bacterium]
MMQDALKEYIIEKKRLWETEGKRLSYSVSEYKKCLFELKRKVGSDRKNDPENISPDTKRELDQKLYIFEESFASVRSQGTFPDKKTLYICGSILRDHISFFLDEASLKEAVRLIYEICFSDGFFGDENGRDIPFAFYLEAIRLASLSISGDHGSKKHISIGQLSDAVRLISEFDFSPFITAFSPIERLWRNMNWKGEDIYKISDPKTKALMRSKVRKEALRRKKSEEEFLKEISLSEDPDEAVRKLCMKSSSGIPYFSCIAILFLLFSASLLCILTYSGIKTVFSLLFVLITAVPLYSSAKFLTDNIFSRLIPAEVIPKLSESAFLQVREKYPTLVVITSLFASEKDVISTFRSLEKRYLSSEAVEESHTDRTLFFSVLADLPEKSGDKEENKSFTAEEISLLEKAERELSALNKKYGNNFFLFTRERSLSPDGVYRGWERKRGALLSLSSFLLKKKSEIICSGSTLLPRELEGIKYVLTLDSDTENTFCGIYPLIAAMVHPFNTPKVSKTGVKHVYEGCAILQPAMRTLLSSSRKTPFSLISSGSGLDVYNGPFYDTYQTVFKKGIFCGKGIFELHAFNEVLEDAFPENIVLSHDLLEGARLSASFISEVSLFDGTPASAVSYMKRASRWIRGDIQALRFAGKYVPTPSGEKKRNPIRGIYRFALFDNGLRAVLPVSVLSALLLSSFIPSPQASAVLSLFALSFYILPPLVSFFTLLLSKNRNPLLRRFLVNTLSSVYRSFLVCAYRISSLAENAYISADAVIRSLYRMNISKKRLLDWQTFAHTESGGKNKGVLSYCKTHPFSLIAGLSLILLSNNPVTLLSGLFMILFPVVSYASSIPYSDKRSKKLTDKQRKTILEYARDSWRYFEENVTKKTNFLPPDNVAVSPREVTAMRTSPTNIGLFLTSAVAAFDMGFTDPEKLFLMLHRTLSSIEDMKKYKGHLYNWYDISSLSPLGDFVSSVDSGNYCACLIILERFLKEYKSDIPFDLIKRTEALRNMCDFTVFYDKKRGFLSIGINASTDERDKICYDRYMSESRITSYIACAERHTPVSMWFSLGRTLLESSFFLGCASWSGTCFEYFMPCLFLPTPSESFNEESLKYAFSHQKRYSFPFPDSKGKNVYGISESCYYSFDGDMNYRYKAFGIPDLALDEEAVREKHHIISPYSSFLMMRMAPDQILNNLSILKDGGMYGKYGFYEAADIGSVRSRIVKCFMAHHIGMSLMACDDILNEDIFPKRFMSDEKMAGAESILGESVPADAPVHTWSKMLRDDSPYSKRNYPSRRSDHMSRVIYGNEKLVTLSGHNINAVVSDNGTFFLSTRSRELTDITKRPLSPNSHGGIVLYGKCKNEVISSFMTENSRRTFSHTENSCTLICSLGSDKHSSVTFESILSRETRTSLFSVSSTASLGLQKAGIYIDVCADTYEAFRSHPAFSSMFVFCEKFSDKGIYLFERRQRERERSPFFMAVGAVIPDLNGKRAEIGYESFLRNDLATLSSYPDTSSRLIMSEKEKENRKEKQGSFPMLSPEFLLTASVKNDKFKECDPVKKIVFIISCGSTASEAVSAFEKTAERIKTPFVTDITIHPSEMSAEDLSFGSLLLKNTFYKVFPPKISEERSVISRGFSKNDLWSLGISGDVPIITMRVTDRTPKKDILSILRLHSAHRSAGNIYDLVFSVNEPGGYYTAASSTLRGMIEREGFSYMMNSKGGIFIIINENGSSEILFRCCSRLFFNELSEIPKLLSADSASVRTIAPCGIAEKSTFLCDAFPKVLPDTGFSDCGYTFERDKKPPVPYAFPIASPKFGCIVTDSSLGFTWWKNSQQSRLTFWDGGIYSDSLLSESLFIEINDATGVRKTSCDLVKNSKRISYSMGRADYYGMVKDTGYRISVAAHPKLAVKAVSLTVFPPISEEARSIRAVYTLTKIPGNIPAGACVLTAERKEPSAVILRNVPYEENTPDIFIKGKGGRFDIIPCKNGNTAVSLETKISKESEMTFFIGVSSSPEQEKYLSAYTSLYGIDKICGEYKNKISKLLPPMEKNINMTEERHSFFNFWLPYQSVVCRMLARSGLYQSGGAYGFRDQLQDCLVYLDTSPEYAKRMILKMASRQFEEGDVLHWFHIFTKDGRAVTSGIRSTCSDDYLWLIFVVCEYVDKTRDRDILDIRVPFLSAPELSRDERERYINDARNGSSGTVREHLFRAVSLFLKRGTGKHSLALMLGGDWNDGMGKIGDNGGESVWLTMFAMICFYSLSVCIKHEDPDKAKRLCSVVSEMAEAVNKYGRGEKWFGRAYYGDGTPVGFDTSIKSECSIDAISQSFAMYMYHKIPFLQSEELLSFIKLSLNCAYNELFDEEKGIIKLFNPPFSDTHHIKDHDPGYIKCYPEGMRENGGQYTHGALWLADAFLLCAEHDKSRERLILLERGRKLFNALIPYKKAQSDAYMREPYVLCADIYSNKEYNGQGGWSWYTGSAGWMYRIYRYHIDKLKDFM